ncbi:AbfB domain-containing protein [Streptomyces coriariae]|uniref:AbfB domain-containing protein n=1 Tax=Streptomyces coriariae TaxID=2864460 RepID=UPI001E52EB26|nr:AbfB domain-containing protein [Streptomyces coriariae]
MPDNKSRPSQEQPWENGWAPDTSRAPGTRRLWLAGGLAVATIVACVTAIALNDKPVDDKSEARQGQTLSDEETEGGLISFATPSASGSPTPTGKKSTAASTSPKTSSSPEAQGSSTPHAPAAPSASSTTKPPAPKPAATRRSVRSVNYPDRYWQVSGGLVKLDQADGSESRADSTFTVVKGLADSSCSTFVTADGTYLRHRDFVLRAERDDGSALFKQDATFCAVPSSYSSGAVMLESVNYPGRFLRHKNFALRLDTYGYGSNHREDFSFNLVDGLA